jgi:outer membrane protein OmpA-like peptidoglycan-associated protein
MRLRIALFAATILTTPIIASAQPVTGLYVGAGVGGNWTQEESASRQGLPATFNANVNNFLPIFGTAGGDLHGSAGFAGVVSVGWGFGNGLRAEIEGNYRNNSGGGFTGGNFGGFGTAVGGGSTEQKFGGMVNALYDFNGMTPWFVPYLGVGVGYEAINERWHAFNNLPFSTTLIAPPGLTTVQPGGLSASGQSTEGSFAYQAILGAAFPLPQIVPGLAATFEYRFLGTTGNRNYGGTAVATSTTAGVTTTRVLSSGASFGSSYNHSVLVGLRYNFGVAPPPPPPPAPPPVAAPARSYLVFFDWDKATLTDRARQIIHEAADNSTHVQYTRIEVNGYTDTSGTARYNMGLSIRRAHAVQAELIKDGVPAAAITIQGFGDTHLLVPTGPGVREPQNRRVEIIIR